MELQPSAKLKKSLSSCAGFLGDIHTRAREQGFSPNSGCVWPRLMSQRLNQGSIPVVTLYIYLREGNKIYSLQEVALCEGREGRKLHKTAVKYASSGGI